MGISTDFFYDVKLYLRIDFDDLNNEITDAINSAKEYLSNAGVKESDSYLYKQAVKKLSKEFFEGVEDGLNNKSLISIVNQLRAKDGNL